MAPAGVTVVGLVVVGVAAAVMEVVEMGVIQTA